MMKHRLNSTNTPRVMDAPGATEQYPAPCCCAYDVKQTVASRVDRTRPSKDRSTAPWHPAVALAALLVFFVAAGEAPVPAIDRDFTISAQPPGFTEPATFKARTLYEHASFLASEECEGRLAGSPGEARARQYIIKHLLDDGFADVRQFPFEFTGDARFGGDNLLKAAVNSETSKGSLEFQAIEDFKPFPISASGEGSGPAVFAGFGISAPDKGYDDYAGLDVKGKVVLVFRGEPETADGKHVGGDADPHAAARVYADLFYKAGVARDKGALALLVIDGEQGKLVEKGVKIDLLRSGGRRHCGLPLIQIARENADKLLESSGHKNADLKKQIQEKLVPASFALDGVTLHFKTDIIRERTTDWNLAVVLPGQDPILKNETVVIGAHYDHLGRGNEFSLADKSEMGQVHCGADDNASGTSSVLELAQAFHQNRASLKRTVWILFFGAEELGTLGSNDFIQKPPPDFIVKNNAAMVNLDMVGRCRDDRVMVNGAATGKGLDEILKQANAGIGLNIKTTADGFGGSDQTAFVTAGVPVLFFFTGSHSDYHKPSDTADKLNVKDQARITAVAYNAAAALINAPVRPEFVKVEVPKMATTGTGGVRLGSMPDYGYDGKGLRLGGVRPGSPADKGGMRMGDVVVSLGGRKIENIYDYMNALAQAKPDVSTPVTVLREGKEVELKVIPERKE